MQYLLPTPFLLQILPRGHWESSVHPKLRRSTRSSGGKEGKGEKGTSQKNFKSNLSIVSSLMPCTELWARITKNTDWSIGPLVGPLARSLTPLTCSLVPYYSLRSRAPLRSLAHFLAREKENDQMAIGSVFFVLAHSALVPEFCSETAFFKVPTRM